MKRSLKYTMLVVFAIIAIVSNLLTQELSFFVYDQRYAIYLAIFMGTGVGRVVKYLLDKTFLFNYKTKNVSHEGRTFFLYTLMGLATTLLYVVFEVSFDYIFNDKLMRNIGAVIGLTLGYYIKYILDSKFVFVEKTDD
ncbi:MAG: GtrA family protein [Saccharospirillaceae bacterium]|nr:GtrA family protein [Saccharospirillaceae bacterium]